MNHESLSAHRSLVCDRWDLLQAFGSSETSESSSKLSPNSQELRSELFQVTGQLKEKSMKDYRKRLSGYVQCLTNASDRLNDVVREELACY